MYNINDLIKKLNETPAVMADLDWCIETNGFNRKRIAQLLEGIEDIEVLKELVVYIADMYDEIERRWGGSYFPSVSNMLWAGSLRDWLQKYYEDTDWEPTFDLTWANPLKMPLRTYLNKYVLNREKDIEAQKKREETRRKFSMAKREKQKKLQEAAQENQEEQEESVIPDQAREKIKNYPELDTKEFWDLMIKLMKAGIIQQNLLPVAEVSRSHAAYLACLIGKILGKTILWKVWEDIWQRKNMRMDFGHWNKLKNATKVAFAKELNKAFE